MKGIWENPAAAAEEADRDRRRRRRQPRRPKQPTPFNSLPAMHLNRGGEAAAAPPTRSKEISMSCPLPSTQSPLKRSRFDPYWPEWAVEEALKKGDAFKATFRVNAHNQLEAYCTIYGVQTDVLINGAVAQNRAIEGDVVAIVIDPVTSWTKLKGSSAVSNPVLVDDSSTSSEVREVIGNKNGSKQQVNGHSDNQPCSSGFLPLDMACPNHKNGDIGRVLPCDSVDEHETSPNKYTQSPSNYPECSSTCCTPEKRDASGALEKICAMISSYPSKRPTGRVLSIIKNSPRRGAVIGFLAAKEWFSEDEVYEKQTNGQLSKINNGSVELSGKKYIQLIPTEPKFPVMVVSFSSLPNDLQERLNDGDVTIENELIAAQIDDWSEESLYPQASVIHTFGRGGEIKPLIAAILFENAISAPNFSPESLDCLPDTPWEIPMEEFETRNDLRNICTFTIDPSSATDLDDALSVEILSNGVFRIGVHIADVTYFVHPDTALDTEAQLRSTSVYILQQKLPMLPPKLSENMGSLVPGVDRLAFSIIFDVNRSGDVLDRWIGRSIINSCCQLSYDLVQDIIDGTLGDDHLGDSGSSRPQPQLHGHFEWKHVIDALASLHEISKRLREIRFKDGALSLENAKFLILFDECGTPDDGFLDERKESCSIVEEFMLLANRSVAEVISKVSPDCALLRRHPEPNAKKLKEFEAFCSRHGFEFDTSSSGQFHLSLSKIREKLKNDPVFFDILVSYASKPMQSATYFCTGDFKGREDDWAHYALSVPFYTHFTSPLRRYPDIIVHRTLAAALDAEDMYLKQRRKFIEASSVGTSGKCFTGLCFDKDAAESEEGREALSAAALKYKVPGSDVLTDVAAYCNERRFATKHAEESVEKLYIWTLLKKKMVITSEARVLGLGPRFMSVYINKLAIEGRVYYADVEGLTVEWLEDTSTLVLDLFGNKAFRRRGNPGRYRPIEDVALVMNPSEVPVAEDDTNETEMAIGNSTIETSRLSEKSETSPAFFPLVLQHLSAVPVALHAVGGVDGPLEIGVRLYVCSYLR